MPATSSRRSVRSKRRCDPVARLRWRGAPRAVAHWLETGSSFRAACNTSLPQGLTQSSRLRDTSSSTQSLMGNRHRNSVLSRAACCCAQMMAQRYLEQAERLTEENAAAIDGKQVPPPARRGRPSLSGSRGTAVVWSVFRTQTKCRRLRAV